MRDVSVSDFRKHGKNLPEVIQKRCKHVIFENDRVQQSILALQQNDLAQFGRYMAESHLSLRDLYQVSCKELDLLVEAAHEIDGTIGARMTGAGFGGCTVNLVKKKYLDQFKTHVTSRFLDVFNVAPDIYVCRAEDGVKVNRI